MTVHHPLAIGFAASADAYERGRPDYPLELVAHLNLNAGQCVLDLGAGTGKFTRLLASTTARVVAVEPIAEMREKIVLPNVEVLEGSAENIPLPSRSIDVVVCAQAFHWFANTRALEEITRVLVPRGELVLIWNQRDESVPWIKKLTAIIGRHEGNTPRYHTSQWREVFRGAPFEPLREKQFRHVQRGDVEMLVDRVASISFIAALPDDRRNDVLRETRALVAGLDEVEIPYITHVHWAQSTA